MRSFHINTGNEPEPETSHSEYMPGTHFTFRNIGGQIKAAMSIPVTIVA